MKNRTHTFSMVTLVLSSVAASQVVLAATPESLYFVPSLSYVNADSDRSADNDLGFMLGLGKQLSEMWNLELSFAADSLDLSAGGGEFKQRGLQLDGLYLFDRSMNFSPYAVVGGGLLRTKVVGDSASNVMVNGGVGVMHALTDSGINLRGDVRYRLDEDDRVAGVNRFGDWVLNIGLMVPFGGKSTAAAPVAAPVAMAESAPAVVVAKTEPVDGDSDGDGVKDSRDSCQGTAAGRTVDAKGCELDGDHDGVVDGNDSCPTTTQGVKVDAKGCELDGDNDGVVDSRDSCLDSKPGARVDGKGCELADVIVLKGVNFETGSPKLTASSEGVLDDVAATLMKYSSMVVEVSGHTDNTGSASFNRRLSQGRADAVVNYLVAKGVNPDNLKAKGYGSDKSVADNNNADGRAANRRVELLIINR